MKPLSCNSVYLNYYCKIMLEALIIHLFEYVASKTYYTVIQC